MTSATIQDLLSDRRGYFRGGEPVLVWENPDFSFGCWPEDLAAYLASERWDLVANVIVQMSGAARGDA